MSFLGSQVLGNSEIYNMGGGVAIDTGGSVHIIGGSKGNSSNSSSSTSSDSNTVENSTNEEVENNGDAEGVTGEGGTDGTQGATGEGGADETQGATGEGGTDGASGDGSISNIGDMGDMTGGDGMYLGGETGTATKEPLLSNWLFVGGISAGTLVLGGIIGVLLAAKKIKKGIELYED